jgi:hypothetical protein
MVGSDLYRRISACQKASREELVPPVTEDQAIRMFNAYESAGASSTARASFIRAGFIYMRGADSGHTLALDEAKVRGAAEF